MTDAQDLSTLGWIKGALQEVITDARNALEQFAEGRGDPDLMDACADKLHQARGTLQMLELYGPAMLAEEMEGTARALATAAIRSQSEAAETLMLAIVRLPDYLAKLQAGAADVPFVLLPLLNDLRAVRDAPLLSEAALFNPSLDADALPEHVSGQANPELPGLARTLRSTVHRGLLAVYRDRSPASGLQDLQRVLSRLESESATEAAYRLFRAGHGLVAAWLAGDLQQGSTTKLLLGKIDREIKRLIDHGEPALGSESVDQLVNNLLFYVAQAPGSDPTVTAIQQQFKLAEAIPTEEQIAAAQESLAAPGLEILETVEEAIKADLLKVKDGLDLFMRGSSKDPIQFSALVPIMRRTADTLGMVGHGALRARLIGQADRLQGLSEGAIAPEEALLLDLAADILFVETALSDRVTQATVGEEGAVVDAYPAGEMGALVEATMAEVKVDMAKVKAAIADFVKDPTDVARLEDTPRRLRSIGGAFRMLKQEAPAEHLAGTAEYLERRVLGEGLALHQENLEALADAISGLEYFAEALAEDRSQVVRDRIADNVGVALAKLRAPVTEASSQPPETRGDASVAEPEQIAIADQPSAAEVDEEIREIFIEEAREELRIIDEQVRRWRRDPEDVEALTTFRRCFHTLKGSGRLVGATRIGELALSIENLLNRLIDGTLLPSEDMFQLLDKASATLSQLIDDLDTGAERGLDTQELVEQAVALASNEQLIKPAAIQVEQPATVEAEERSNAPQEGDEEGDEEILSIFLEEADEELELLNTELPKWKQDPEASESLTTIRRCFHTLKGSGRMVGAVVIGELAWAVENLLNRVLDGAVTAGPKVIELVESALSILPSLLEDQRTGLGPRVEMQPLIDRAFALAKGEPPAVEPEATTSAVTADAEPEPAVSDEEEPAVPQAEGARLRFDMDPTLLEIFENEALTHLNAIANFVDTWRKSPHGCVLTDDVMRAFHTLHGSAHLAGAEPIVAVAAAMEALCNVQLESAAAPDEQFVDLVERARGMVQEVLPLIRRPEAPLPDFQALSAEATALLEQQQLAVERRESETAEEDALAPLIEDSAAQQAEEGEFPREPEPPLLAQEFHSLEEAAFEVAGDANMVDIFLEEARDLLAALDASMHQWRETPDDGLIVAELQRLLHTLKGGARLVGIMPIGDLSHALEALLLGVSGQRLQPTEALLELAQEAADQLAVQADEVATANRVPGAHDLVARIEALLSEHATAPQPPTTGDERYYVLSGDSELREVFLEEARALLESLDESIQAWRAAPQDAGSVLDQMQRYLHTLKGGARLAGMAPLGDLSHALEGLLSSISKEQTATSDEVVELAQEVIDRISSQVDEAAEKQRLRAADDLVQRIQEFRGDRLVVVEPSTQSLAQEMETLPPEPAVETHAERGRTKQEQVRVASELLDRLVNHAGEVSIYRARLEQQNSSFAFTLDELEQTVDRLRSQLRQLEIETEAQILYRYEQDKETDELHESFDPLELDRFSTMQQLSRSLMETVNDLTNIKDVLGEMNRDTDALLLQQSRVATDLQDGLLRTRMVPFSQIAPRLHRLVRQTCRALGNKAELRVYGADQEVDRTILERMVAPLEHLLRNAVSHGIESPQVRKLQGKPETGKISIYLGREGTDVVLNVSDDGAGVDLAAVRARAIERGLLDPAAVVTDDDILHFVLASGFSTAKELTQISGRGVGLDVVNSELKQLGGSMDIESQSGRGSNFMIRLPLTLAISEGLLAQVSDEVYAIPFASIEAVVRVGYSELERFYQHNAALEYAGREYQVRYLGGILGADAASFPEGRKWFPVLLVHSGEHRIALQVDDVLGNRHIVVKSVGPQLTGIRWITGATILGDGRIALILDLPAMVRMEALKPVTPTRLVAEEVEEGATVLVVDDSITVRKVTSRLLQRHNMTVLTAKDGMDAIAQMQERIPDVMLLDIEMPRMDGFEVARHMRNTAELKKVPIIMITSRTGEKHRQRAMDLGVKRYLGKPYQEGELLDSIYSVLYETQS